MILVCFHHTPSCLFDYQWHSPFGVRAITYCSHCLVWVCTEPSVGASVPLYSYEALQVLNWKYAPFWLTCIVSVVLTTYYVLLPCQTEWGSVDLYELSEQPASLSLFCERIDYCFMYWLVCLKKSLHCTWRSILWFWTSTAMTGMWSSGRPLLVFKQQQMGGE